MIGWEVNWRWMGGVWEVDQGADGRKRNLKSHRKDADCGWNGKQKRPRRTHLFWLHGIIDKIIIMDKFDTRVCAKANPFS